MPTDVLPPLRVGQMLYGYCEGHFGRDSYEDKRIEAIGYDWIVCRDENGTIHFAECGEHADNIDELLNHTRNLSPQRE